MKEMCKRRGPESYFLSTGHRKNGSGMGTSWCLSCFSTSECRVRGQRLDKAQPGRVQIPHSWHSWGGSACIFSLAFSFHLKNFHFDFQSMHSQHQLFSDEDGDEKIEKYLPELCKHFYQTHTQGKYSLGHIAKPFVITRPLSNCTLLGLPSKWFHLVDDLQGLQNQNLDVLCTH